MKIEDFNIVRDVINNPDIRTKNQIKKDYIADDTLWVRIPNKTKYKLNVNTYNPKGRFRVIFVNKRDEVIEDEF